MALLFSLMGTSSVCSVSFRMPITMLATPYEVTSKVVRYGEKTKWGHEFIETKKAKIVICVIYKKKHFFAM